MFLDLKKAYDSVPVKCLIEKLVDRHLEEGIVSLIASLFTKCTTRVLVNKTFIKEIHMDRGLMQGAILSPLLFSIFLLMIWQRIFNSNIQMIRGHIASFLPMILS